jgi:hypothetical protein
VNGQAYVDNGVESQFVHTIMQYSVFEKGEDLYIVTQSNSVMQLATWFSEHRQCVGTFPRGVANTLANLKCAVFRKRDGVTVWWALRDLYTVCGFTMRGSADDWVQCLFPSWINSLAQHMRLPPSHLKRGLPRDQVDENHDRVLDKPAGSSHFVVGVCARLAGLPRACGGLRDDEAKTAVGELLQGFFQGMPTFKVTVFVDEAVEWHPPSSITGVRPCELHVVDGRLSVAPVVAVLANMHVRDGSAKAWRALIGDAQSMLISELLVRAATLTKAFWWLFSHLVCVFGSVFDAGVANWFMRLKREDRIREQQPDPPVKGGLRWAETFQDTAAGREKRIIMYWQAGRRAFDKPQFVSIAADSSRVGGRGLMNVAVAKPDGVAMWACPQDLGM